jgi:hypothetical protein
LDAGQLLGKMKVSGEWKRTKDTSNNAGKIEGTKWKSLAANIKGQQIAAGLLSLEFSKDGKMVYRAGPQTFTGTCSLGQGDSVTFHLEQQLAGRRDHTETITIAGDRLTMTDADGTSLTFERVKQ